LADAASKSSKDAEASLLKKTQEAKAAVEASKKAESLLKAAQDTMLASQKAAKLAK